MHFKPQDIVVGSLQHFIYILNIKVGVPCLQKLEVQYYLGLVKTISVAVINHALHWIFIHSKLLSGLSDCS